MCVCVSADLSCNQASNKTQDDLPTLKLGAVRVSVAWPFSLMMVVVFPSSQLLWHLPPMQVNLQMVGVKTTLILPVWLPTATENMAQTKRRGRESRRTLVIL